MKTKAQILLFVLCVFFLKHKAQTYFNNLYDTYNSCDGTAFIDTFQNDYITSNFTCSSVSFYALNLKLYSRTTGSVNVSKTYHWTQNNFGTANGFSKLGNKFLLTGSRFYKNDTSLVFQWLFDENLDSIKYIEYGYLNKANVVNKIISYRDKYYYMVGQVYDNFYNSDILIIKTDTAGNEIWKKKIGSSTWDESAISIDTVQSQLVIAGNKMPHSSSNTQGFVMRLDTAGNVLWQKTVVTNGGFGGCVAKTLKDGNILVYSRYKMYSIGSNDYYRLQVEKITPNNVSLWSNKYNAPAISANPYSAIENKHGNIVIVGQACYLPGIAVNGVINEIAQNGDSLLHKEFYYQQGCQNYFRDVIQATDGGYCFAGFFTPVFANGCTGTQDIWLLKVDSNFCESAVPCGADVGVSEAEALEASVKVFPNPAKEFLEISFLSEEPVTIELTNTLGQMIWSLSGVEAPTTEINIKNFKSGMYYLTLKTKDKTSTTKFVKVE